LYLAYGNYICDTGAVHIATDVTTELSPTGRPIAQAYTFTLRGTLTAANQSAMATAIVALEDAFRVRNQNLILYQDDASESAVLLKSAGSLTGVRILKGPYYPTTEGPENATHRTWEVQVFAKYPWGVRPDGTGSPDFAANMAIQFEETVSISGGGPQFIHKPNVYGPWQKQLTYPFMPYVATQTGTAVGYRDYPKIPPPLFSLALKEAPRITRKGPQQEGLLLVNYTVTWEYQFESVTPLVGLPHFWRNL